MGTIEARLGALPGLEEQAGLGMSFERVCALSDVKEPGSLRVELDDVDIAVVRFEGEVYAIEDLCSHAEVPADARATSRSSRAPPPSSAGCTGRASTCAPANPPTCRPPSRCPSTRSAWRGRTCTSTSSIDDSLPAAASN